MSAGEIAGLIASGALVVLVLFLAFLIVKAGRAVDAATKTIKDVDAQVVPILSNVNTTVDNVNTALTQVHNSLDGVNIQLERLDTITGHAAQVTSNVANLSTVVTAAASNPLVKVAAFGYGLRKTVARRRGDEEEREVRDAIKVRRKERKALRRGRTAKGR